MTPSGIEPTTSPNTDRTRLRHTQCSLLTLTDHVSDTLSALS